MRLWFFAAVATISACTAPAESPSAEAPSPAPVSAAVDDGSYLERIDPLGGQWRVERIGNDDFTVYKAWIDFSEGGFLNHSAGCGAAIRLFTV